MPLIVMGVSGSGKSTIAEGVAADAGAVFLDADDFHPASSIAKMVAGEPLTDVDRRHWLATVGDEVSRRATRGQYVVVACSALRREQRDILRAHAEDLTFAHLVGARDLLAERLATCDGHPVSASVLSAQLDALEPLASDEHGVVVDVAQDPRVVIDEVLAGWPRRSSHSPVTRADVAPELQTLARRTPNIRLENRLMRAIFVNGSKLVPAVNVAGVKRRVVREQNVDLRIYQPSGQRAPAGGLFWIHGGGLVIGAAKMDDRFCGETAARLGITVVSVEYRASTKHGYPIALDDLDAAWQWLQAHAEALHIDTQRIAVGGQSAGGGLAAAFTQKLFDRGDHVAAQWLFCPMVDDRTAADRSLDATGHLIWNNRANLVGWTTYLGKEYESATQPYAVASRRKDLSGLPPAWVYASDIELFFDEDVDFARSLRAAGVDVVLEIVRGAPHGFESWAADTALAKRLTGRARDWLGRMLS
ncbi:gluconokinase, GntK/IdnK-type [Microbacterium sp. NPDC076911]|uniref:gluconokinase, GntK/IdnK-type n=1 Tax=Microbacterium sp. NPDC076911 TaxID=3154958 RepID=UPI0034491DD3